MQFGYLEEYCTVYMADLFSRQCDYVQFERKSTNLSKEQSSVLPAINCLKPGSIIDSSTLKKLLHAIPQEEFLDVNEKHFQYIQKLDWSQYQNINQKMTSEREFIIASLLNHSPDTALKLQTLRDIFQIKEKGGH